MAAPATAAGGETRQRHLGRGHIQALDGVRGCAVLGVMASHLITGNLAVLPHVAVSLLGLGVAGVDVFFVLSGFLITGILRDSLDDPQYFRKFYARRVLRIFPLYYGVVLVLLLLTRPLHVEWAGVQWSLLLYLQNTHVLFPSLLSFHSRYFSVDHFWSLAVEEQFYLLWPLLLARVRRPRWVLMMCAAGIALSFALRVYGFQAGFGFDWVNRNTLCRADELLGGAALAMLLRSRFAGILPRIAGPLLFFAGTAVCLQQFSGLGFTWFSSSRAQAWEISLHYTLTLLFGAGLVLCCVCPGSTTRRCFEWAPLRWFGKYSYGLYVLHLLLLPGITLLLIGPLRSSTGSKLLARAAIAILVFLLSTAAAFLSFHGYEKHFLRLKRYFDYAPVPARNQALQQQ